MEPIPGGEPGKEIQAHLAVVVLGGLLTSTFLNMVVVPVLYARWGGGGGGAMPGGGFAGARQAPHSSSTRTMTRDHP